MKLTKKEQNKLNKQLFAAIENNDLTSVKKAVTAGADVNAQGKHGWTPLLESISYFADIRIMDFLLEHGADPNLQNEHGNTTLHRYFATADTPKIKLLLDYNADMYIKNNYGRTPFTTALRWEKHDVAEFYVMNGYVPSEEEDFGVIKNIDKRNKLKARFMELARAVKVNALQAEAEEEGYCDEVFDF